MFSSLRQQKQRTGIIRDIFIGMSDGLTVPLALAAGLTAAGTSTTVILIAGAAAICAGAVAMGVGGYTARKTEMDDHDVKSERNESDHLHGGMDDTKEFFAKLGLSKELQEKAMEEIAKDKNKWSEFMMNYERGAGRQDPKPASKSAFFIAGSYVVGGLVPLSPFFLINSPLAALQVAAVLTLICLFTCGFFKSKITGLNPWLGGLRMTVIGALAAAAAFGVARIFQSNS